MPENHLRIRDRDQKQYKLLARQRASRTAALAIALDVHSHVELLRGDNGKPKAPDQATGCRGHPCVILPASITADAAHDRMRLDVFISSRLAPEYSRSQVARTIKAGLVTVYRAAPRASRGVRPADRVAGGYPP